MDFVRVRQTRKKADRSNEKWPNSVLEEGGFSRTKSTARANKIVDQGRRRRLPVSLRDFERGISFQGRDSIMRKLSITRVNSAGLCYVCLPKIVLIGLIFIKAEKKLTMSYILHV